MQPDVFGDRVVRAESRCQHEPDLTLLEDIRSAIAHPCLRPAVRNDLHAKCRPIVVGSLLGVADVKLDVIGTVERQEVALQPLFASLVYQLFHIEPPVMKPLPSVCLSPPHNAGYLGPCRLKSARN